MIGNAASGAEAKSEALLPPPYDPTINPWTPTGPGKHDANSEEGWTLIPDGRRSPGTPTNGSDDSRDLGRPEPAEQPAAMTSPQP
jgi:hypothetical protein